jgi:diguanylate cyclase (GGDEF)-like protein
MARFPKLEKNLLLTDSVPQRWMNGIKTLGFLALIFALAVAYYLYDSHLAQQKEQLRLIGSKTAANFDHEMTLRAYSVTAMGRTAEQYLTGRSRLTIDPIPYLRYVDKHKGYTLDRLPGYAANEIGSITGAGPVPERNSLAARELAMTIGLWPLFRTQTSRDSDTPWVYYTSQSRFSSVFPRMSTEQFFFSDKSLAYDVFRMALPQHNPQRTVFWTPPYQDEAGKGMMVTVAAPVYEGERFRGSVAVDITLSKLSWLLDRHLPPHSRIYLYTAGGDYLAGPELDPDLRPADLMHDSVTERGDSYITDITLKSVPWNILLVTSRPAMRNNALLYALPFSLVVVLLFGSVMLLLALIATLRKAQECSIRDSLTGIYNRRHFDAIAERELTSARRDGHYFGLMMIDIDYFKVYNDTYGHQAGDTVLKAVSRILSDTLRRSVDNVFRVGGEEFAILTKAERPEQIELFAQVLLAAIEDGHIDFRSSPYQHITVSVGVTTLSPKTEMHIQALYAKSDEALYRAKEGGRNCVVSVRE